MNTFFTSHSTRIRSAVVLAALAASGLFSATQAQAQPRSQAPVFGSGRWNNGNDPWNEREVMSGEVVRRYSNTEYDLRAGDGHVFRVRSDDPISLNRGDDVRIGGDWRGSTFYARTITLIDRDNGVGNWGDRGDWNNGFRSRIDVFGFVVQRYNPQTFEVRSSTGRTYLVRGDNSSPNLRNGDRVKISGLVNGNRIRATQISNLSRNGGVVGGGRGDDDWYRPFPSRPNGGFDNGGFGRGNTDTAIGLDVDFPGVITSINRSGREATVRGDNGRSYNIRTSVSQLNDFRVGDRIRVRGEVRNDYITVDDLKRIR